MAELDKMAAQMRADWDRRIKHDYRFWMSDGYATDEAMWQAGERDIAILLDDLGSTAGKTFLEVGCGVGRLVRAASKRFSRTIGFDVSSEAIRRAQSLVGNAQGVELYVGDGYSLKEVVDESVDVAISFAAISSMPTDVAARYLRELRRVLKPAGKLRLQVYIGEVQIVSDADSLHLRCYRRENYEKALQAAGFSVDSIRELTLPFQVSCKELGIEAVVVSATRGAMEPASADVVSTTLLPAGDAAASTNLASNDLEYWMSLRYARELADSGDLDKAKETLEYALRFQKNATIDVRDILNEIVAKIQAAERSAGSSDNWFDRNMAIIRARFPRAAEVIRSSSAVPEANTNIVRTEQGPVIHEQGQCLDHPTKPQAGAERWVTQSLNESRLEKAEGLVVVGFAAGYHLEVLRKQRPQAALRVIEPSVAVMKAALTARNLAPILETLAGLSVGPDLLPEEFDEHSELLVRPQTMAVHAEVVERARKIFYGTRGIQILHPSIAVLGPMMGGTLPIAGYTARALSLLGQRMRPLDVSGFSSGFHMVEKLFHNKTRQALCQNMYVEMVSHLLLESFNEKPVDILVCMAQAPVSPHALQELRKRGVITALWFVEDYLRFTYWKEVAKHYDFIFTIQRGECINAIRNAGCPNVSYLPVACDPAVHGPVSLSEEERRRWGSPMSFVGAGYYNRQQVFAGFAEMPFKIWGTEWPTCRPFDRLVQEEGRRLAPEEYNKIFNATDININLHSSSERDGVDPFGDFVNPRTFELAAAGAFQLCDERSLLPEMFVPGEEIITFKNPQEVKRKALEYLEAPEERRRVAERARARALRDHTYQHRLKEMVSLIYSQQFERLRTRELSTPWNAMVRRTAHRPELQNLCETAFKRGEEAVLDALVADIMTGKGKLSDTETKLLFLHHIRKQIINMKEEGEGERR